MRLVVVAVDFSSFDTYDLFKSHQTDLCLKVKKRRFRNIKLRGKKKIFKMTFYEMTFC